MVLGNESYKQFKLTINGSSINSQKSVKLLGITIDSKLNFNSHIENICNMASYKVFVLQRIRKYISTDHAETLASAFINSQFNYCSIIWMFCSKKSKQKIESIHKRT